MPLALLAQPKTITSSTVEAEKDQCTQNLRTIFKAISAYQSDKKDLPNWLSDLVPNYLPDPTVLVCPVCRRTGATEQPDLADPKLPSSYLFEFCPLPLGEQLSPNAPGKTRREWKRRQMSLIGSDVPLVRCRHHMPFLNLAFDGRVYGSPPTWENLFTNRVSPGALLPTKIFPPTNPKPAPRIPPRAPNAKPAHIDLTRFYNVGLKEPLHRQTNSTLSNVPVGLRPMAGVQFDIRGAVQLASKVLTNRPLPSVVKGIPINQKCARLHFLHAAGIGTPKDEGTQIGAYILKFADNEARLELPIVFGRDVLDWVRPPGEKTNLNKSLTVAWTGTNAGRTVRLFKTTWINVAPEMVIESVDFVSAKADPAPFLISITAE